MHVWTNINKIWPYFSQRIFCHPVLFWRVHRNRTLPVERSTKREVIYAFVSTSYFVVSCFFFVDSFGEATRQKPTNQFSLNLFLFLFVCVKHVKMLNQVWPNTHDDYEFQFQLIFFHNFTPSVFFSVLLKQATEYNRRKTHELMHAKEAPE